MPKLERQLIQAGQRKIRWMQRSKRFTLGGAFVTEVSGAALNATNASN
jgi:hypothetical protein